VRLLRIVNGERRQIAGRAMALGTGEKQTLRIKAIDTNFSVSLDGKLLFETHDDGIATPGRFGIWSRADSFTSFGDLFITILD
jgi:hypothetical protein